MAVLFASYRPVMGLLLTCYWPVIGLCRSAAGDSEKQPGLSVKTDQAVVTVIPNRPRDSQTSDSDSDGPILYRGDDDEEDDEDEYTNSTMSI